MIGDTVRMLGLPRRHTHLFLLLGLTVASSLAGPACSTTPSTPTTSPTSGLAARIDGLIAQPRFAHASWGVAVVSLDSGRTLYTHRADRLAQPASTAKLFTAAASLATLGPDYRFPTRLLSRGTVRHGRLDGHLILYGTGDPTLGTTSSSDWAEQLAAQLYARGIRQVHGDLIADDSYFTGPPFGAGWEAGDLQSWFAVPSSALSVDENIVSVTVTPGASPGASASVRLAPVDGIPKVLGRIETTPASSNSNVNLYRAPGSDTLYMFGSIPARATPARFRLAMVDPALQAARQLRVAMTNRGINFSGATEVLHWPLDDHALMVDTHVLAELRSPPVMEILQRGLKRSQNLYLQNLLLGIGAQAQANGSEPPGGFRDSQAWGIHALRDLLPRIGIAPASCQIAEGTGLSRRDLVTPNALVRVLVYLAEQPYADQWREALPLAGVDGTLIHRMRETAAAGNLRAKTGGMSHVHSLAGYVTTASGDHLAFAIMLDNYAPAAGAPPASRDVDAVAVLLADDRGGN
ncbi:MAG TPA: D-alanyl-D-alanine carboxypeptidase/D-alanyl-D-alanine-endopeptidase [Rhodanobacter sp.]|nr:D-alanyl-D-alanine carboxypeptidase/D-alanyl-D-alanine-endopeptidase [Rhodanobacter sp.]